MTKRKKGKLKLNNRKFFVIFIVAILVGGVFTYMYMTQPTKLQEESELVQEVPYHLANETMTTLEIQYAYATSLLTETGEVAQRIVVSPFSTLEDKAGHEITNVSLSLEWWLKPEHFELTQNVINTIRSDLSYNITIVWDSTHVVKEYTGTETVSGVSAKREGNQLGFNHTWNYPLKNVIGQWYNDSVVNGALQFDSSKSFKIYTQIQIVVAGQDELSIPWNATAQFTPQGSLEFYFYPPSASLGSTPTPAPVTPPPTNTPNTPTNPPTSPPDAPVTPPPSHPVYAFSVIGVDVGGVPLEYILAIIVVFGVVYFLLIHRRVASTKSKKRRRR